MFSTNLVYVVFCMTAAVYLAEANTHDCSTTHCPSHQTCILQVVLCKRAPCPPISQCVDMTEYICYIHKPCLNGGKCHNTRDGGYVCTCAAGFTGESCQNSIVG
ncbi:notch homolog 2 N-terminal-like protein C [Gigantopelta aegis]|uniref:notch homolog 2 N-terminal-like protein C n=1 Tax=Gigantopelta aegis TaxID=1735272 RepID=UPI001B88D59F|nr:notch homolog 2 N-terminal-like protein C [Gigantopelta aegis]